MSRKEEAEVDQEPITEAETKPIETMNGEEADPKTEQDTGQEKMKGIETNINRTTRHPNRIDKMTMISKINQDKTMIAN